MALSKPNLNMLGYAEATLTDAATISWDLSTADTAKVTLGGNRTLGAPTNQVAGQFYHLMVIQDGTGGRTLSYNAVYKGVSGVTITATIAARDHLTFRSDGTDLYLVNYRANVGA